jgi:hypothetical protein
MEVEMMLVVRRLQVRILSASKTWNSGVDI